MSPALSNFASVMAVIGILAGTASCVVAHFKAVDPFFKQRARHTSFAYMVLTIMVFAIVAIGRLNKDLFLTQPSFYVAMALLFFAISAIVAYNSWTAIRAEYPKNPAVLQN